MRTRTKYIIAIFLIVFLDYNWSFSDNSAIDPYSFVEIPVYHKGYNVKQSVNHSKQTKSLSYHVQTNHPAAEVIEFYDAYLNGRGWRSSFEICQRNWGNRCPIKSFRLALLRSAYSGPYVTVSKRSIWSGQNGLREVFCP